MREREGRERGGGRERECGGETERLKLREGEEERSEKGQSNVIVTMTFLQIGTRLKC